MQKVISILDRYLLLCRQSGNGELLNKANKLYSTILRNNCYDLNNIIELEKQFKTKGGMTANLHTFTSYVPFE